MTDDSQSLIWQQLHWSHPVEPESAVSVLRQWAADQRSPQLTLETHADRSGVRYLLGGRPAQVRAAGRTLAHLVPGSVLVESALERPAVTAAARLRASTRHRALRTNDLSRSVRAVLAALMHVQADERLILQVLLGPRRVPLAIPNNSPSSIVAPWWQVALYGNGESVDPEKRTALRDKVADHGFAATVRIGVVAPTRARQRTLVLGLLAALRTGESPGLRLKLTHERLNRIDEVRAPWRWPLRLNVQEVVAVLGWPLGDEPLPGQPAAHPRRLPPAPGTLGARRVIAQAGFDVSEQRLSLPVPAALHHLHVLGPTGTGKSTLLAGLINQDIAVGHSVVVIEPKGDLVRAVLEHLPAARRDDLVLLDPLDENPVGLNPLASPGTRPELLADRLLSVLKQLYGTSIGPRSADILYGGLLTLAQRPDASLVMLPLLLTNPGFRRSLTSSLHDPIALEPFWATFESWSEAERAVAVAPVMNKLRPLLRPQLRAVLGQRAPRFAISELFTHRRVLLVPLQRGVLGPDAASLLGSLLVAELWQASLARTAVLAAERHPVMIYIDEVQDFLRLPVDLGEALAQARGLGVSFTAAHQFLSQLPREMQAGLLNNARSRICFQLAHDDAVIMAKGHAELTAEDLTSLGQYELYASLFARGAVTPYTSGRSLTPALGTTDMAAVRQISRRRYGRSLDEIEASFAELIASPFAELGPTGRRRRST